MSSIGYGAPAEVDRTISAADVAAAASSDISNVRSMKDTGAASTIMMQGAIICLQELLSEGRCDGVVSFGGASSTTLATGVMKTVPAGIPKLVVSSAAAIPAYAASYFGSRDITIMHAVVDISGLNDLTRAFLKQGAGAICGMADASDVPISPDTSSKLVAVSSFRFSEICSQAVTGELEDRGYATIPFHAQGVGENASFGTIFSILRRPEHARGQPDVSEFLQPGVQQVCAGYAIYGPSCMLVITTGNGVNGFTLDPLVGEFFLTHPGIAIAPSSTRLYANIGWARDWSDGLRTDVWDRSQLG